MASAFSGAAELCLHQGRTHSLIKQLPQKLDEILSFAFRFNTESCDSALCRKLFIRLPENLTQLGSPPHKQTPGHEWCLGQQWDARTTMEEFLNHYCCLFIDIEYFYAQQFLWISGVNELYKIHTSSSFLFHENETFSCLQILNFAFSVAQYKKKNYSLHNENQKPHGLRCSSI